jgi:ABC-2 type transport system ATP-binding protein
MSTAVIEAKQLTKIFRVPVKQAGLVGAIKHLFKPVYINKISVDHINLIVRSGESVAYIGPNGAGKSTTVKMLTGILAPSEGEIRVCGRDPHRQRVITAQHIGVVFGQRSQLWWDLPVQESLRLLGDIYAVPASVYRRNLNELVELLDLAPFLKTPARQLSLGQRMRCDIAAALLHSPDILFLDEPTIGLDVAVKERLRAFIKHQNRERGVTILLTSHDLRDIEEVCERVSMIDQGRIVFDGSMHSLRQRFKQKHIIRLKLRESFPHAFQMAGHLLCEIDPNNIEQPDPYTLVIRFHSDELSKSTVIARVIDSLPINDVFIEEPSVETIIQRLYEGKLQFAESV